MDTKALMIFIKLSELGSLTRASLALEITNSTISRQLAPLQQKSIANIHLTYPPCRSGDLDLTLVSRDHAWRGTLLFHEPMVWGIAAI